MPGYTSPKNIPFPLPSEPPNGAAQMESLANKVDDLLVAADSARSSGDATLTTRLNTMPVAGSPGTKSVEGHLADLYTKVPTAKAKWGETGQVTTDGNGRITVNHAAGWFPRVLVITGQVPGNDRRSITVTLDADSVSTSSFSVWVWDNAAGGWYANKNCGLNWIIRD